MADRKRLFLFAVLMVLSVAFGIGQSSDPQKPTIPADDSPKAILGDWMGTLNAGALKLRIVFHIGKSRGGLSATLDSPDQGATGVPVDSIEVNGKSIKLELSAGRGGFEGTLSDDGNTIDGTWKPVGLPLLLKRVTDASTLKPAARPQEPRKPYPYRDEEVSFDNKAGGSILAGTLTVPSGKGPFPAVVLIPGSGAHDRDESIFGHKPFLVLADALTRKGIAVLRYDDRGVGKSTGNIANATTIDLAGDAEAAFSYLKSRAEIDSRRIGLIGHSEGGIIAPMIAARNHDLDFIVMLAGSGVPGDEVLVSQTELLNEAMGASPEVAANRASQEREVLSLVKQSPDNAALKKAFEEKFAGLVPEERLTGMVQQMGSPWYRYFITYDPAPTLRKVTCPVLALNGDKDTQVSSKENLPAIRAALQAGGNKNFEIDEMPGLNHLFQTAKTGAPSEYPEIDETMSPAVLEKVSSWILKLGASPAPR